ncbi:hypothetical protein WN55_02114 [Dufourea novaeangliae]|uniref:Uncharacterized protein n=1 Tax=Dufourea novaeangliae TaxID=178035 RepID=A0A154NX12_DUFNO|nr:hypothetical protein WN55_02114 [Dufourea novaeangliae]
MASSPTGGVKAINIEGRMARERKRLLGMTDEERAWRAKFLKSQIIPPGEPIETPEYYKEYYNPLKRLIRIPLNLMENSLAPIMGKRNALVTRTVTSKLIIGIVGIYCTWYYAKYNTAVCKLHLYIFVYTYIEYTKSIYFVHKLISSIVSLKEMVRKKKYFIYIYIY